MKAKLLVLFLTTSCFLYGQATIELLLPWDSTGNISSLGLKSVQDQEDNYLILSNVQIFEEGSGIPIEGPGTTGSGISRLSNTGEYLWKNNYATTLLTWVGILPTDQILLNSNDNIIIPFAGAVGLLYCDSVGSNTAIGDGFKKGILEIDHVSGEVIQTQYFVDDFLCERDKVLGIQETQDGYVLLYTERLYKYPLYIEKLNFDLEVLDVDTFESEAKWIQFSEYDETILIFSQHNFSMVNYEGAFLEIEEIAIEDTLLSPAIFVAENENHYVVGMTAFNYNHRVSTLYTLDKEGNVIQNIFYGDKVINDVEITDDGEVLVLFDLSRNNFYDTMPKPVNVTKFDIDLNEISSRDYGFPFISPTDINLTNDQQGFLVTGTRLKSVDVVQGREANQVYFLKDEIEGLVLAEGFIADVSEIKIYPNPVSEKLNVSVGIKNTLWSIKIYDNLGRQVKNVSFDRSHGLYRWEISMSSLASGFYSLSIETDLGWLTKRVVKH